MKLRNALLQCLLLSCLLVQSVHAQDSAAYLKLVSLPNKILSPISIKSLDLQHKLSKRTEKYLLRLMKHEKKLQQKLWKKDSVAAKELFGNVAARYAGLHNSLTNKHKVYSSLLDSVQTALQFFQQNNLLNSSAEMRAKLKLIFHNYTELQNKFNQAGEIKKQLSERQQYLGQQLKNFGLVKEFKKYQKDIYYYRAQVDEYKNILETPSEFETHLLRLANKIPAFKKFFNKHSMLAEIFRPGNNDPVARAVPIPGLQTRASIQQHMLQQFGSGADLNRAIQQNIQSVLPQINQIKEKIIQSGSNHNEMNIPDFKPNSQKVKSFWQRIELGTNIQSAKSNSFFPVTTDLALTAGYKLNDNSIAGIGISYKLGWGQNIRHIRLTHEGIGFRSFVDLKMKASLYISGGFEYNYQQPFNSLQQLHRHNSWHQSGLIGISKIVSINNKVFGKTRVQLLWDVLSYEQVPRQQPLKFRVGYSFK